MFAGYFVHTHTIYEVKCCVFILTQLNINQRQRLWALMDTHTRQPLLYPLIYLIDQLALRSSATQSASLQALKFFYEFWHQKHGVTFCFSFYSSNHNPLIAIDELTAFFHYLENTHLYVPALTIRSTTQTTPQRRTNIRHIHSVMIRAKALGINPVWQNMVAMMLTGELTSSTKWQDQRVVGIVGDQLHDGIGGCSRDDGKCPFSEVRCCYGCLYFRPFSDGDHQAVLESVVKEVDELISVSDSVGNARNPLLAAKWVCFSKSKICNAWNGSSRVPVRSRVMVFSNTICPPHAECLDTPSAGDWRGANIDYASRHIRCGGGKYINNSLSRAPAKSHG
ncbi:hypothetical protein [Klebsiella variicola]|uniref:hypothetical protein n=1 Tax=Klebsiella variicola TaxID=244366 RepID=UPI001E47295E|nr:hypothetical protein [Klebsiella variicola]